MIKAPDCEVCDGSGLKYPQELDSPVCATCGGSGIARPRRKTQAEIQEAAMKNAALLKSLESAGPAPVAHTTSVAVVEDEVVVAPIQPLAVTKPSTVILVNPGEAIQLVRVAGTPPGQVWVISVDGVITKVGAKE